MKRVRRVLSLLLCTVMLAAALVMGGVIPQEGLMTAGRCAALLGAVASGVICGCMAKERKVQWAAVASGCTAVCALMGNLLFVGQIRMPLLWLGAVAVGALVPLVCCVMARKKGDAASWKLFGGAAVVAGLIGAVCLRVAFYNVGLSVFMFY